MSFRTEDKIVVTRAEMFQLHNRLVDAGMTPLYPARRVTSVYLDARGDPMLEDSEEGVLPRKKIRIRHYDKESDQAQLEIKTSSIEGRFKTSRPVASDERLRLLRRGLYDGRYGHCLPRVVVSYARSYFSLSGARITFDRDIRYSVFNSPGQTRDYLNVVELKVAHDFPRDALENIVSEPRRRFSKFARASLMARGVVLRR